VLLQLIVSNNKGLSWEVPDMCLWMFRELINNGGEQTLHYVRWLICLLDPSHHVPAVKTGKKGSAMSRSSSNASCNETAKMEVTLSPLSPELAGKVCQLLMDLLLTNHFPVQLKTTLRELGGLLVLIELIKASPQELALMALATLHVAFSGIEESKLYLANELGYRNLLEVVVNILPLPDLSVVLMIKPFGGLVL